MQPSPHITPVSLPPLAPETPQKSKREDLPYQAFTVVAILMVLISLWVF